MKLSSRTILSSLRYGARPNPTRDWILLLVGFVILLAVSVIWNLVQFAHVVNGRQVGTAPVHEKPQVDLTNVNGLFDGRAQERARYESEYQFVDPSI